jgi:O-methyltransferase
MECRSAIDLAWICQERPLADSGHRAIGSRVVTQRPVCGLRAVFDVQSGASIGSERGLRSRWVDNFFIAEYFDWRVKRLSLVDRIVSRALTKLGRRTNFRSADFVDGMYVKMTGNTVFPVESGIMTNIEQRMNMYHLASQVLAYGVQGDFVELGCNTGDSSVLMTKLLEAYNSDKRLSVYDSFEGLPSARQDDGTFLSGGDLKTSEDVLRNNFKKYNLPLPAIHKGWFQDTLPTGLPEQIAFAYLDGDFYDSIIISLQYVYPKLTPGSICLIDDYCDPQINPKGWNRLPGVKKACDEYLEDKPEKMEFIYSGSYSHGFFRKAGFSKP